VINPELSLTKSASATVIEPGDSVLYSYIVQNTGDDLVTNVVVTDDKCSPVSGPQNTAFAPGQSALFFCEQVLDQATTNTGTATGIDSLGNTVIAQDSITVRLDTYYIYLPIALSRYR
jgi:hypothetical protein